VTYRRVSAIGTLPGKANSNAILEAYMAYHRRFPRCPLRPLQAQQDLSDKELAAKTLANFLVILGLGVGAGFARMGPEPNYAVSNAFDSVANNQAQELQPLLIDCAARGLRDLLR
jgi:hypothetical protein